MENRAQTQADSTGGFSLTELLVVMLIFAVLTVIAVRTLISTLPQRQLHAAAGNFANDIRYSMTKARASGNTIYLGFTDDYSRWLDESQVHTFQDAAAANFTYGDSRPDAASVEAKDPNAYAYLNPANPGVARAARKYYIVEARPRYKFVLDPRNPAGIIDPADPNYDATNPDSGRLIYDPNWQPPEADIVGFEPFTYEDWVKAFRNWDASPNLYRYPIEPIFPYNTMETIANAGYLPAYDEYDSSNQGVSFNRMVAPLALYPQEMLITSASDSRDYVQRFFSNNFDGSSQTWNNGITEHQIFKTFCTADRAEIMAFDVNNNGQYDEGIDHERMKEQVVDYVLLKLVELPEHVYFMNPWADDYIVGWEDDGTGRVPRTLDMQFLQYLMEFQPSGKTALAQWTYDPAPFPSGSYANLNHGSIQEVETTPDARMIWMLNDECIDFVGRQYTEYQSKNPTTYPGFSFGSRINLALNTKIDKPMNGRVFTLWPFNGSYYVDDYTPNDGGFRISTTDTNFRWENMDLSDPIKSKEISYAQDFLMDPGA